MTRRDFLSIVPAVVARTAATVNVPVHIVTDGDAKITPHQFQHFWWTVWPEAVRDLARCKIRLETTSSTGGIWRPPSREPVITGLERRVLNLVLTDRLPLEWDNGRMLSGVTTRYRGFHVCMIALRRAHGHQIPLLSVNTCVHELLHALMGDIFENRPPGFAGQAREFRIDWYATRLWLTHTGGGIHDAAQQYVQRLRPEGNRK